MALTKVSTDVAMIAATLSATSGPTSEGGKDVADGCTSTGADENRSSTAASIGASPGVGRRKTVPAMRAARRSVNVEGRMLVFMMVKNGANENEWSARAQA